MKIINEQLIIEKPEVITVEYIENCIKQAGFIPLRWSIVKVEHNCLTIDLAVQCFSL